MENKPVYIHYGDDTFRTPDPIKNRAKWVKPYGGLWASRKDTDNGWKDWCKAENFRLDTFDRSFEFTLRDDARVLMIDHVEQLFDLPTLNSFTYFNLESFDYCECYLDFEKLMEDYDAIEVAIDYDLYNALYGWDCDSILIMNPDIVEIMEENVA